MVIRCVTSLKKLAESNGWCDRDTCPCVDCYFFIEAQCDVIALSREQVAQLARELLDKVIGDIIEESNEEVL